jgi:hypothetical protein
VIFGRVGVLFTLRVPSETGYLGVRSQIFPDQKALSR